MRFHLQRAVNASRKYISDTLQTWEIASDAVSTDVMVIEPSTFAKLAFANSDKDDYVLSAVGENFPQEDATATNMAQLLAMDLSVNQADVNRVIDALKHSLENADSGEISALTRLPANYSVRAAQIFCVWSGKTRTARADREIMRVTYDDIVGELRTKIREVVEDNVRPTEPDWDKLEQAASNAVMARYQEKEVRGMERVCGGILCFSWNSRPPLERNDSARL